MDGGEAGVLAAIFGVAVSALTLLVLLVLWLVAERGGTK